MTDKPLEFWLPALEHLRKIHGLPEGDFQRVPNGKNIVCRLQDMIIKLIPPFWAKDAMREVIALKSIQGKLSVDTPRLEAMGELENWHVIVMSCLQGTSLNKLWTTLDPDQKAHIAFQMGEIASQLHSVDTTGLKSLNLDWQNLLDKQRQEIFKDPYLPKALRQTLPDFLDGISLPSLKARNVFLHGDISAGNLLLRDNQMAGLIDFGDAKLGEFSHEFISPASHMFRGDSQLLQAFYSGYGLSETHTLQSHLMVRALLWYGWEYLGSFVPKHLSHWEDVASFLWGIK